MKKNFLRWAFGDIFTKIAGGIFGGSVVALYYNELVLTQGKTIELLSLFWLLTIEAVQQFKIGWKRKADNALNQKRRNIFGAKTNCGTASILSIPLAILGYIMIQKAEAN